VSGCISQRDEVFRWFGVHYRRRDAGDRCGRAGKLRGKYENQNERESGDSYRAKANHAGVETS
jgi:hypothetical protein